MRGDVLLGDVLLIARRGVLYHQPPVTTRELSIDAQTRGVVRWAAAWVASGRLSVGGEFVMVGLFSCGDFFGVFVTPADTDYAPSHAAEECLEDIEGVEGVHDRLPSGSPRCIGREYTGCCGSGNLVRSEGEGEEVQYREDDHLKADQEGVEPDGNIAGRELSCRFDDVRRGQEIAHHHLPETEEYDELDTQ